MSSVREANAERQREQILDAALVVLAEGGPSERLLSAVAREAGISRPTLYRYFESFDALRAAVVQRELTTLVDRASALVDEMSWDAESVGDLIGFVVVSVRDHPLFSAGLRDVPGVILPQFTTHAFVPISYAMSLLEPRIRQRIADGALPDLDVPFVIDLLSRIAISFAFTNGVVSVDSAGDVHDYLRRAVGLALGMAVTRSG